MIGGGRFWMMPPTTLAAIPGKAEGWGIAMVGMPGGNPTTGAAAASILAATTPASPLALAVAAPASVRGAVVLMSGIAAEGCTGMIGVAAAAAVVGGGATTAAPALGAGGASSFLLHPNEE